MANIDENPDNLNEEDEVVTTDDVAGDGEDQNEFNTGEDGELTTVETDETETDGAGSVPTPTVETEELDETPEEKEEEVDPNETRICQGLFAAYPVSDYTQNKKYSDTYLKQKGLFKEE